MGPALTANATEPEPVFLGVSAPRAVKPGGVFIRLAEEYRESSNLKGNLRRSNDGGQQLPLPSADCLRLTADLHRGRSTAALH